jgi:hypothetical protein
MLLPNYPAYHIMYPSDKGFHLNEFFTFSVLTLLVTSIKIVYML